MSEHPFERLRRNPTRRQAHEEIGYEEDRVSYLLKALKLPASEARRLRAKEEDETTFARLTFARFNEEYPSFPLLLGSSILKGVKLHLDPRAMIPALFKSFDKVPFVTAYEEFYERVQANAQGRAIALVFRRNGFRQGWCLFNDALAAVPYRGVSITYVGGPSKHPLYLYLRPFQTMVESIHQQGHGWRP